MKNSRLTLFDFIENDCPSSREQGANPMRQQEFCLSQDSESSFSALLDMIDRNEVEYEVPVRSQISLAVQDEVAVDQLPSIDVIEDSKIDEDLEEEDLSVRSKSESTTQEDNREDIQEDIKEDVQEEQLIDKRQGECIPERIVFPEEQLPQIVDTTLKLNPVNVITNEPASHSNYCELHKQKFSFMNLTTKKLLCHKCLQGCESDIGITSLMNIAMEKISKCKDIFEYAQKHIKDCDEVDLEKWKCQIRKDLYTYFEFLDSNMKKLKDQAFKEVNQIFDHNSISEIIQKRQFIKELHVEISDRISQIQNEIKAGNYSSVTKREKLLDHIEKTLLLLTIESKQYQSKIVRRQVLFDSLIAKVKAMIFKIDDALFSTVLSKIPDVEKSNFEDLFASIEIKNEIPPKSDVTPLYCYYREFIKGKNLKPLQGCLEAINKWEKIQDSRKNIFFTIAKQHNDSCIESMVKKALNHNPVEIPKQSQQIVPEQNGETQKILNRREMLIKHIKDNATQEEQSQPYFVETYNRYEDFSRRFSIHKEPISDEELAQHSLGRKSQRSSENEIIKCLPSNLKVIEKRILQKEMEKKLDPIISNQIKSLENMNSKKREEKNRLKIEEEESDEKKYEKSQLTRIHRIMKTIC